MKFVGENSSNWMPSNLANPLGVPSQRYPSGVWAMPLIVLLGKPSSDCQDREYQEIVFVAKPGSTHNQSQNTAISAGRRQRAEAAGTGAM